MIHYRTGSKTIRNRAPKRYVAAVLGGILLGGAYALAGPGLETQALSSKAVPAHPVHIARSLHVDDDCVSGLVGVVVALPVFATGHGAKWSPAHLSEPVCTWAI